MGCAGNEYEIETLIQLNGSFYNTALNVPADPQAVSLFIEDPDGNVTPVASNLIIRTGVGLYYSLFLPPAPGSWTYKWRGTGSVIATSPDTRFFVKASVLVS